MANRTWTYEIKFTDGNGADPVISYDTMDAAYNSAKAHAANVIENYYDNDADMLECIEIYSY